VAEQRLSRKEIRQPDPFVSLSVHIIAWMKEHPGSLIYGIVGVVVAAALITGWWAWQKHRERQAEIALYEATKLVHAHPANRSNAMEHLQKLISDYGNTAATALAHWHLGHLYFEREDYTAALTAYRQVQQQFSKTSQPLMVALVTLDVAYAQEARGACDPDAITSFEAVLQLPAHWLRGEAYLGIGRCHEKTGASQKAVAVYERALSDGAINALTRQTISDQIAFLQLPAKKPGHEREAVIPNKP
jgi:predicted negative regulator of RcsB-dependent stress response